MGPGPLSHWSRRAAAADALGAGASDAIAGIAPLPQLARRGAPPPDRGRRTLGQRPPSRDLHRIRWNESHSHSDPAATDPDCRTDWPPAPKRHHLESTAAHELGPVFGLAHNEVDWKSLLRSGIRRWFRCAANAPTTDETNPMTQRPGYTQCP